MKLCSIASGSSGNSIYVGSEKHHVIVDAGISAKRIEAGLQLSGVKPEQLEGILVTHEHSDHIKGIEIFTKKYHTPVYATEGTIRALRASIKSLHEIRYCCIKPDEGFYIGDIYIEPFSLSHDASNPVSYTLQCNGHKIGMATDLGTYTSYTVEKLSLSEVLYLECNHDINMLMVGKYPYSLKRRIAGANGHLSNDTAADLIKQLLHRKLKHILLAHMSKENNYAELAYETVRQAVSVQWQWEEGLPDIVVENRDVPSEPVII